MSRGMNWDKVRTDRLIRERGFDSVNPPSTRALKAKAKAKRPPKAKATNRWWLTKAARGSTCDSCRERVPAGEVLAFAYPSREVRCRVCIDREGIAALPSKRLEAESAKPAVKKKKAKKAGRSRTLPTLGKPVRYVDSGWTEAEWLPIADAMRRYDPVHGDC